MTIAPVASATATATATDDELGEAIARGDHAAFAELYDRFAPRLLAEVMATERERDLAEQLVGEIFIEFWRTAPRRTRSVESSLLSAAINTRRLRAQSA